MGVKTHELVTHDEKHYAWLVWCPACDSPHTFRPNWGFDGNHEAPTFTGWMLVHGSPGHPLCHSHLQAGIWHYGADCTHAYAGQSLPAPDWASTHFGRMRPDVVVPEPEPDK